MIPERPKVPKNYYDKNVKSWNDIMKAEGGALAKFTDTVLKKIEELKGFDASPGSISLHKNPIEFGEIPNTLAIQFPEIQYFNRDESVFKFASSCLDVNNVNSLGGQTLIYFKQDYIDQAALILESAAKFKQLVYDDDYRFNDFSNYITDHTDTWNNRATDMGSPINVFNDNIQTLVDVIGILVPFSSDKKDLVNMFSKLVNSAPPEYIYYDMEKVRLNPHGYTYIELFGFLPFGTLARFRSAQPMDFHLKPVVEKEGEILGHEFLYYLMKSKFTDKQIAELGDSNIRHGGCPAHYPEYRDLRLIKRLGEQYLRILNATLQSKKTFENDF